MRAQTPSSRNLACLIPGISIFVVTLVAVGCGSGGGYQGGGGGGGSPSLGATVVGQGSFALGEQGASFTITVSNTGNGATSGTVTVADPPTGFTVTAMSGTDWACALATKACTYGKYVGAGGSFPPITVTGSVTAATGTTVTIPLTLSGGGAATVNVTPTPSIGVAAPSCSSLPLLNNEGLLNGNYIAIMSGWNDGGGPSEVLAAFSANGAGLVSTGEMDSGEIPLGTVQSTPKLTTIIGGCYQLGPDFRGLMIWNFTGGGSVTLAISVSPNNQGGAGSFLVEFDDANPGAGHGTRLAGRLYAQIGGPFTLASFNGPLAFVTTGYSPNSNNTDYIRSGTVGRLDDSATGVITNGVLNVGFTSSPGKQANLDNQAFTGTFGAPDGLGRGILTIDFANFSPFGPLTLKFAYYISDTTDLYLQSINTPDNAGHALQNGDVITQALSSFTTASFNGNAVLFMAGVDLSASHAFTVTAVGQIAGDGMGGASAMFDEVANGVAVQSGTNTISGGSFAVSPNGMGVLTVGAGAGAKAFSVAMRDLSSGWLLEGTAASPGSNVITGSFRPQRLPPAGFTSGTLLGAYTIGVHNQASTNSAFLLGSVMTPTPQTNPVSLTGLTDASNGAGCNIGCLSAERPVLATYNVDVNGRITISMPGLTSGPAVGWFLNQGNRFLVISDITDPNATVLNVNH